MIPVHLGLEPLELLGVVEDAIFVDVLALLDLLDAGLESLDLLLQSSDLALRQLRHVLLRFHFRSPRPQQTLSITSRIRS